MKFNKYQGRRDCNPGPCIESNRFGASNTNTIQRKIPESCLCLVEGQTPWSRLGPRSKKRFYSVHSLQVKFIHLYRQLGLVLAFKHLRFLQSTKVTTRILGINQWNARSKSLRTIIIGLPQDQIVKQLLVKHTLLRLDPIQTQTIILSRMSFRHQRYIKK